MLRISTLFLCASTGYLLPRIRITQQEQDDAEAREAYRAHVLGRLNDLMDRDPKLRAMLEERAQDGL